MSAADVLFKIGNLIAAPVESLCNWTEEPLRRWEHERHEKSKDNDVQRDIQRQVGVEKELSNQRMKEQEHQSELNIKEQAHRNELHIRRETEITRIITEIEQLKKDKEFERMKAVSDAMMAYQTELTRINVDAFDAIGSMRMELQKRAHDLIVEKKQQFDNMKNKAIQQAIEQFERIDTSSNMSDASRNIIRLAIEKNIAEVINDTAQFIRNLDDDMKLISKDISLIASSGQQFIQRHLEQFQLINFSGDTSILLTDSNQDQKALPSSEN